MVKCELTWKHNSEAIGTLVLLKVLSYPKIYRRDRINGHKQTMFQSASIPIDRSPDCCPSCYIEGFKPRNNNFWDTTSRLNLEWFFLRYERLLAFLPCPGFIRAQIRFRLREFIGFEQSRSYLITIKPVNLKSRWWAGATPGLAKG